MTEQTFHIPKRFFEVRCVTKEIPLDQAAAYLTRRRQRKTTEAIREGNRVLLKKHIVVCMNCGKSTPAYEEYLEHGPQGMSFQKEVLEKWASDQLSFFHGELPDIVRFNKPAEPVVFRCPYCGSRSWNTQGEHTVVLRKDRRKILVSKELDIRELMQIPWLGSFDSLSCAFRETVTMNVGNGRTYSIIEDGSGGCREVKDLTEGEEEFLTNDPLWALISGCKVLRRAIRRHLSSLWGSELPLPARTNGTELILMTRFIGYPAEFYNELPFLANGTGIRKDFRKQAKKLHWKKAVSSLLDDLDLATGNRIRNTLYRRPSVLFYEKELSCLNELFPDRMLFWKMLNHEDLLFLLLDWRRYPGKWPFLREVRNCLGEQELFEVVSDLNHAILMNDYLSEYMLLDRRAQLREQKKWSAAYLRDQFRYTGRLDVSKAWDFHSVPAPKRILEEYSAMEGLTGSFSFRLLRNTAQYVSAGRRLSDPLADWEDQMHAMHAVFLVCEGEDPLAKVEVCRREIVSATLSGNRRLRAERMIEDAVADWAEKNGLILRETW